MRNAATLHLDVQLLFITCRLIFSFLLFSYFSLFFFLSFSPIFHSVASKISEWDIRLAIRFF